MKKIVLFSAFLLATATAVNAQDQTNQVSGAAQSTQLALTNAIDISYYSSYYGGTQNMVFNNVNDFANGVTTNWQILIVKSNKDFNITVKTTSANFTYSGSTTPAPVMPVANLNVGLFTNGTGGTATGTFNNKYAPLSATEQTMITNGSKGSFQYFFTRYKATPGFAYPAGTYSAEVVYTATQI